MNQKILFLENNDDFEFLKNITDQKNLKIFTLNIETHSLCESNKITHKIAEDHMTQDDHKKIFYYTTSLYEWYDHESISKELQYESINLLSIFDTAELHHFLIREIYIFFTIKRVIESTNTNEIICNSHIKKIIELISNKNFQITIIKNSKHEFSIPFQQFSFSFSIFGIRLPIRLSRKTYVKLKNLSETIIGKFFGLWHDPKNKQKSILFLEFNPEQYSNLFFELSKTNKNIVLLNTRRPAIWNFSSIRLLKKFQCNLITPDNYLTNAEKNKIFELSKKYIEKLEQVWQDNLYFKEIFTIETHSIWPIIKNPLFEIYEQRLFDYLKLIKFSKKILTDFDFTCIISLNIFGETEKAILKTNKEIPTILLEHGFTNYVPELSEFDITNMYTLFQDKIALWGDIQKDYLIKHRKINENKILVVGSPRHDVCFNHNCTVKTEKPSLLILPGQLDEANAIYDTRIFLKYKFLLSKLFSTLKQIPNISYTVKIHPSLQKNNLYIKNLIQQLDPNIKVNQFTSIFEEMKSCTAIVNIFTELFPSTSLLEGLIFNKPILNISLHDYDYKFEFEKDNAVFSIKYNADIKNAIKKILFDNKFRSELINSGQKHVNRYLSNPGTASKKLASVLNSF